MSIGIRKTFNLDMVPGGAPPVIHVSAGDVGRPFRANLLYSGETYGLDAVTSVKIRGTKPDKTVFEYDLTFDAEDSHVDFVIEEQMAIIAGQVLCEIRLFSGEDTIGSANFILDVETAVFDPNAISESEVTGLNAMIQAATPEAVADWIEAHPEAVTTVQDGAISYAKLDDALQETADTVTVDSSRIDNLVANAGDTDNNAELLDIRVGAYGDTFSTAGNSVRGQIKGISEKTKNLLNIYNFNSPNNSMTVENGVATNAVADTRTNLFLYVRTYNGNTIAETIYSAAETVRRKVFTFTATADADRIRLTASGSTIDLNIEFLGLTIEAGETYTLSFDITGAGPSVVGGLKYEKIQLETGATATDYFPYVSAVDYTAREHADALDILNDPVYSVRYLLTARDYLTRSGYCMLSTGEEYATPNYYISDFVQVAKGDVLTYTLRGSDATTYLLYMYDADKNPLEGVATGNGATTDVSGTYTVPVDGFVKLCTRIEHENPVFEIGNSGQLLGVKALIKEYADENFPAYWREAVNDAVERYYAKNSLVADHGVSFAFVTDTHWPFNAQNSARLISYFYRKTNLNIAVHGGDFVRYGAEDIYGFMEGLDKGLSFLPVIGNHEYDGTLEMTRDEVYAYGFKQSENIFTHRNKFNYCYDYAAQKVRFISLDYSDANAVTLLDTWTNELESGWSVVVLCHMYWEGAPRGEEVTLTQIGMDIAGKIDELNRTANAEVVLYLSGHVHRDLDTTTTAGVPIVTSNCDAYSDYQSYNWGGYKMYGDNTTSQCIDFINIDTENRNIYFTRLGVGNDRQFTY